MRSFKQISYPATFSLLFGLVAVFMGWAIYISLASAILAISLGIWGVIRIKKQQEKLVGLDWAYCGCIGGTLAILVQIIDKCFWGHH